MKTSIPAVNAQLCSTLLMSRPAKEKSLVSALISGVFHASVIGLALVLTSSDHHATAAPDETFNILPVPADEPTPAPTPLRPKMPAAPQPDVPGGFKTLPAPTYIPRDIPPVLPGPETDVRQYSGVGVEGGDVNGKKETKVTAENIEEVVKFVPRTVDPELKNRAEVARRLEAAYPPALRDAGIGGRVILWILIDESGNVLRARVDRSSSLPAFDEAALKLAEKMQFTPAWNRDARVKVWIQIPIVFVTR